MSNLKGGSAQMLHSIIITINSVISCPIIRLSFARSVSASRVTATSCQHCQVLQVQRSASVDCVASPERMLICTQSPRHLRPTNSPTLCCIEKDLVETRSALLLQLHIPVAGPQFLCHTLDIPYISAGSTSGAGKQPGEQPHAWG